MNSNELSTINKKVNSIHAFNNLVDNDSTKHIVVDIAKNRVKLAYGSERQVEVLTESQVVNKRYYTTEHKNQLAMIPDSISFICSGKLGLSVTLDDNEGVTLKSDKNLTLTAPNEVIMKTDTKVVINGSNKLEVQRESKQTGARPPAATRAGARTPVRS